MKTYARNAFSVFAAATLVVGGVTVMPQAQAYISNDISVPPTGEQNPPNVKPLINGSGIVNCTNSDACIDPETRTAHVEFQVQAANAGLVTSDHGQSADRGAEIAIPKELENVNVRIDSFLPSAETAKRYGIPQSIIAVGADLPIFVSNFSTLASTAGYKIFTPKNASNIVNSPELDDLDTFLRNAPVSFGSFEDTLKGGDAVLTPSEMVRDGDDTLPASTETLEYRASDGKTYEYTTKNAELYNYITTASGKFAGVFTYTISGDIKVDSDVEEIYLPFRAAQKSWKCFQEGNTMGDLGEGCIPLKDYRWAQNGALPYYDIKDAAVNKTLAARRSEHGLEGSPKCATTRENGAKWTIGEDANPRNFEEWVGIERKEAYDKFIAAGFAFDREFSEGFSYYRVTNGAHAHGSAAQKFIEQYNLGAAQGIEYFVSGYGVEEDGCDQAVVKLTWCPKEEQPVPSPSKETETIVSTTRETVTTRETTTSLIPREDSVAKCVARNVGMTVGVMGAIGAPFAILSQLELPGMGEANAQLGNQLNIRSEFLDQLSWQARQANDEIQRGLGVYNDNIRRAQEGAAREAERIQRELGVYNESVARSLRESNLPAVLGGLAATGAIVGVGAYSHSECVKDTDFRIFGEDGSSVGSSAKTEPAAKAEKAVTTSTKVTEPTAR